MTTINFYKHFRLTIILTLSFILSFPTFHLATARAMPLDASGNVITYYPASLLMSHTSRPLVFFTETKLAHLTVSLKAITSSEVSSSPKLTTTCSNDEHNFFLKLLKSTSRVQHVISRLLTLPGYSNLMECDSYLRRFYYYDTGLSVTMDCPRTYKASLAQCKLWALGHCRALPSNVRVWLQSRLRYRRSAWACHAGALGFIRGLYELGGGQL